jgi:hypothetical protein
MHLDNGFYSSSKQRGFDDLDNHPNNTGHHWSNQMDKYAGTNEEKKAYFTVFFSKSIINKTERNDTILQQKVFNNS